MSSKTGPAKNTVKNTRLGLVGDSVQGIEFPEAAQAVNDYPIAVIAEAPNADLARAFQELVTGAEGRAVLGSASFGSP